MLDEFVENSGHFFIVFRIDRHLLNYLTTDVIFDCFGSTILSTLRRIIITFKSFAFVLNKVKQGQIIKVTNFNALRCNNVVVNELAHIRLVCFEIEEVAAIISDGLFQLEIKTYLMLEITDFRRSTAFGKIWLCFCKCTNQFANKTVELFTHTGIDFLRFLIGAGFSTEIMQILQIVTWIFYTFTKLLQFIIGFFKVDNRLLASILNESGNILLVVTGKGSSCIGVHCEFKISKEFLVIDNVAKILAITIIV